VTKLVRTAATIAGALALVGGGFAAGWFAKPSGPPVIGSSDAKVVAPTGPLSKEDAQKLVQADYSDTTAANMKCWWAGAQKKSDREWWVFMDDMKCAHALESAGLLKIGKCAAEGCPGGCCNTSVLATGQGDFYTDGYLYFPCGSFKVGAVTSVATDGNKATIKYGREFIPDTSLLSSVADCKIDKPEMGKAEKVRYAQRDDAGAWALMK